jgi:hypothetical protein
MPRPGSLSAFRLIQSRRCEQLRRALLVEDLGNTMIVHESQRPGLNSEPPV